MRDGGIAPSLPKNKKLRSAFLLRFPRFWLSPPRVSEFVVPPIGLPQIAPIDIALRAVVANSLLEHFNPSPVICVSVTWTVNVQNGDLGKFVVVVFGIRYRSATRPKDESESGDECNPPEKGGERSGNGDSGKAPNAQNPYLHLYGDLYPPPDEFAADVLTQFAELRPYQKAGVEFLVARNHALLADDMGLGKTAQCWVSLAVLLRSERIRRALIICPKALVTQWEQAARRWANLNARHVDGKWEERVRMWNSYPGVIVATPNIVLNDIDFIKRNFFDLVVCDDVSMLKNAGKITTAIRSIPRERSWCLSGTPLENRPEDFTNIMEFVKSGLFTPNERLRAPSRTVVQDRIKPYFLRRRKTEVLKDLPDKVTIEPIELEMDGIQASAYRLTEAQRWDELQKLGGKVSKVHVFKLINALLQICSYHNQSGESAKADAVGEQLDNLFSEQPDAKALVFTPWVETIKFLEREWSRHHPMVYHGGLSQRAREAVLDDFRKHGKLLLMSIKAGRVGLNLQEASYVYHFDRTWNPIDEMQSEGRAHRMGQERTVFVYRFIQRGTIEERVDQVLAQKRDLFERYVDSPEMVDNTDELAESNWSLEELIELMRPTK